MELGDTGQIALKSVDVFEGLPDGILTTIRAYMDERRVAAGTVLFSTGDPADAVYFVRQGTVRISRPQTTQPDTITRCRRGELVGEMAFLDDAPRCATAVCETDCHVLVLSRSRFLDLLSRQPLVAGHIIRVMSTRARENDLRNMQELEAAKSRLEAALTYRDRVLAFSPYPIVVTDVRNRIRLINRAAERLFGAPGKSLFWEWVTPRDTRVITDAEERLAANTTWQTEVEILTSGGDVLICKIVASAIADTGDGSAARLWIFEDLTEMRALQQRAVDRERLALKGEMAGEIAHELNNYLAVLMGNVELLPMFLGEMAPPAVTKALGNIQQALNQIALFTDNLLRSRHPAGQRAEIDLNEFLRNQIAFLHPQKRLKRVVIQTEWDETIPKFECDASGLQQVFYNLLLNAADALAECGPDHHTVFVTTRFDAAGGRALLIVGDDGPGIPPQVKQRIFRERISTKPTGHGFGLLTIARIIEEHGGTITAGARDGGGAEFTISLPVRAATT